MQMQWIGPFKALLERALRRLGGLPASFRARWVEPRFRRAVACAVGLPVLALLLFCGLHRVRDGEVGILVNNLTGTISVEKRAGYRLVPPWFFSFQQLDRRVQALTMAERAGQGFGGGDAVRIKTSDGSNVALDIQVSFRLIPEKAAEVVRTAGPELSFGELWVRSAVRSVVADEYGGLTTEQVYNAAMRTERAQEVVKQLNRQLLRYGLEVVAVVAQDFRFYKEYEAIIKQKKLADQEVEEQQAMARLAQEEQQKQVAMASFAARAKLATATGEAERTRAAADGYDKRIRIEAEGKLVTAEKNAEGLLAVGLAEAQGLKQSTTAMAGGGGVNLVALEYARQLSKVKFTGTPVLQDGRVGQYRIHSAPRGAAPCADGTCAAGGAR